MKNICVFGSSSENIEKTYLEDAEALGEELVLRGYNVVFGAGKCGVMGAVSRGVRRKNGYLIGVSPELFEPMGVLEHDCSELIITDTMRERKAVMEDRADAFVVCADGIGMFEEFFELLTLKQLQVHGKPIIVYNFNGYYDPMLEMMDHAIGNGFMISELNKLYTIAHSIGEVFEQLENYVPFTYNKYGV